MNRTAPRRIATVLRSRPRRLARGVAHPEVNPDFAVELERPGTTAPASQEVH